MRKNKWTRLLALCLAAVCVISVVGALSYDLSGDGVTNVWDLQLAINQGKSKEEKAAALREALGGDEMNPNADGVYEIYSLVGLKNMVAHASEGASFKLMKDIDLKGLEWTPVKSFYGNFDGNGKTISNFKITQATGQNVGFFDTVDYKAVSASETIQSVVENLTLRDVVITLAENSDARFVGFISGSNRGLIKNCATEGVVNDLRTTLPAQVYIGTIVGRNNNSAPDGVVSGSNAMDALEYYDYEPVEGGINASDPYTAPAKVNSMMATNFAALSYPEGTEADKQYTHSTGIAGYTKAANIDTTLVWQDITNSSKFDSQILRDRRTTVAAAMYDMSTMFWTPDKTIDFYQNGSRMSYSRTGGYVYRGLPYNHGQSSIQRFMAYSELKSDGLYHLTADVPTMGFYFTDTATYIPNLNLAYEEYINGATTEARKAELVAKYPELPYLTDKVGGSNQAGFPQYIGADCSSQTLLAWHVVNATSGEGKVTSTHTSNMYMCEKYSAAYGILPVNNFILAYPTDKNGDGNKNHQDKSIIVKEYTRANKDHYMESLGCVTKGDLLMDYTDEGGHTLMAMSDAVVIRNYKGVMDLNKSYIVTAEQGGSGGTRKGTINGKTWYASCCVDEVNSFEKLFGENPEKPDYPSCFFPITCAALQQEDTPAAQVSVSMTDGTVQSNFQILSSTVNGKTVYAQIQQNNHRAPYNTLVVKTVHPDVAAGDKVEVLLADGNTYSFTY